MELPLGGPALRHYTQSRPRPHRQKLNYRPSRPQETIIESENEVLELMGRVDEGVEEFFTKRVLPADTLKQQDEESITVHEVAPASSVPCPPPTKTLRRKLGDFFTLKKRRGLKSETSHEGRPKKASIADLIRPLREVARSEKEKEKDKDRVKELDKENEKEKAKEPPSAVTGESAVQETPVSGAPPLRGEEVPPRRALREGKSQSLILLSGSAAAGSTNARNTAKKQFEGQNSFEQKLHLMLQRIGVSKPLSGETQNQEGEMKKAESEGTIIDSKPEPPPTFSKPRTMSASSDTRHQIRASVSAHEGAGKPALLPKPVIRPGPPPTTSGRNTPENELGQIQEAETNTPTELSPAAAPSVPADPALAVPTIATAPAAPAAPSVQTISNSVTDLTNFTVSPSSTVTPSDIHICTDSPVAAIAPTDATGHDDESSGPETTTITSTTTPTEPHATVTVISTSSDSITPSLIVTSNSTITGPAITTSETASVPSNKSSVSTASTNLSAKSTLPEPNGIHSVVAAPAASVDATISITTTASSPYTSVSDVPSGLSTNISEASHESALVALSSSSILVTQTVSSPPDSSDIITVAVSHDPSFTTSSTMISNALPPTTSTSSTTAKTISQTSINCISSVSTSAVIPPATDSTTDTSVPSTSSSKTNPTDTPSTATSLNRADTTSTSSSATTGAISSPLTTDSDPSFSNNVSTKLTPTISSLPATANTSAASTAAPSNDSPGQDSVVLISPEERSSIEPAEKGTAIDGQLEMVHKSKVTETDKKKELADNLSQSEKPMLLQSEPTRREEQGQSVKAGEETLAEPASGKEHEWSADEGVKVGQKQEETKPVSDK